ncbi:cyclin-T1-4 [Forsythia ovata]|uniref:Cyclin-T1-4 n=1 Tax=Forsythia ovata TaxID=205694 RepID=A0ABD1PJ43_9LAMI
MCDWNKHGERDATSRAESGDQERCNWICCFCYLGTMSLARPHRSQGGPFHGGCRSSYSRKHNMGSRETSTNYNCSNDNLQYNKSFDHSRNHDYAQDFSRRFRENSNFDNFFCPDIAPSSKRRKFSDLSWGNAGIPHQQQNTYYNGLLNHDNPFHCVPPKYANAHDSAPLTFNISSAVTIATRPDTTSKRDRSKYENEDDFMVFVSRDEIERCSPSRKDGIDSLQETHLRYSYCAFLQNLGVRLDMPQTTIGTAMVLCHRFFFRRSHASHDRFLIATAALFLSAKSEETARPLNDVLRASCEILHKQDFTLLSYLLPIDWFEQYRERIFEAEQLILTTLNFELNVQHPYDSLTSTLEKLGLSQSVLVVLALNLVSEGLRSSLWLQFKPHQIAAGAAYLAAKFLNMNLASCNDVWHEFQTSPSVLKDVAHQLMELF